MAEIRSAKLPVTWLIGPALGTCIVPVSFIGAIQVLPSNEWLGAFNIFLIVALALCLVVFCAIAVSLVRLYGRRELRTTGNFVAVVSAPVVAGFGILMMVAIMAPLSGGC